MAAAVPVGCIARSCPDARERAVTVIGRAIRPPGASGIGAADGGAAGRICA